MKKVFIIAEAGINHNGDLALAKRMIDIAAESGADAVKFQAFIASRIVTSSASKAPYQTKTVGKAISQLDMLKKYEFGRSEFAALKKYCDRKKIMFLAAPFDTDSLAMLISQGLEVIKIPSGEITDLPLLRAVGKLGKKIIMSTGMADMGEIKAAMDVLTFAGTARKDITLLHCRTEYPAPFNELDLKAMLTMRDVFGVKVGFSDHTLGLEASVAAVALGAEVIEKHFTFDKKMKGPDHKASLDQKELGALVRSIRNIEKAIGDGVKRSTRGELLNKSHARKSIVAAKDIKKNEIFANSNITVKRPGTGLSPVAWDTVIGKSAKRDFMKDEQIEL
ncbi:MAG: N-acetylneuraminate synthase [Candidatus Omnitrophica bacterium]|nr:N-acetylneuraminate synthase [Candidatus Omnitrophota bacterium]